MKFGMLSRALTGALVLVSTTSQALPIQYAGNRAGFEATLGAAITDTYEAYTAGDRFDFPNFDGFTDAAMSAVLGETDYRTTGFPNNNIVVGQPSNVSYCAGCNGSFELGFTTTSVGDASGVFGVGFDVTIRSFYHAFVTFGDNTSLDVDLSSLAPGFWGITADERIRSIHVGLANGLATTNGFIQIDNLTIGRQGEVVDPKPVPEPAGLALVGLGLGVAGLHRRRRRS